MNLIIGTPKIGPLILGKSHVWTVWAQVQQTGNKTVAKWLRFLLERSYMRNRGDVDAQALATSILTGFLRKANSWEEPQHAAT